MENKYKIKVNIKEFEVGGLTSLKVRGFGYLEECLSHGDMNANNMIFDEKTKTISFIDFEKTGFWHVYRDFISLSLV
tara:strand:+ start:203 stop:433 length:231 start_codon:yes stop_codon:yes gene_type:complete